MASEWCGNISAAAAWSAVSGRCMCMCVYVCLCACVLGTRTVTSKNKLARHGRTEARSCAVNETLSAREVDEAMRVELHPVSDCGAGMVESDR